MYRIERFFWTSLPNGVIAFGWFSMVYSIFTALYCMFMTGLEFTVWYTVLGIGFGYLMIVAVKNRSDILLLPWLVVSAFHIVIVTPITIILLIWNISDTGLLFGYLIYIVLPTLLIVYGWVGVYSLYHILKNEYQYGTSERPRGQV